MSILGDIQCPECGESTKSHCESVYCPWKVCRKCGSIGRPKQERWLRRLREGDWEDD